MTHDTIRHGTLTLFAALNYLEGKLIAPLAGQHRHQEWLSFLRKIDRETPKDVSIHLIADNYSTHNSLLSWKTADDPSPPETRELAERGRDRTLRSNRAFINANACRKESLHWKKCTP
jgi:hypothetical protein